jgi:hypothetical protein
MVLEPAEFRHGRRSHLPPALLRIRLKRLLGPLERLVQPLERLRVAPLDLMGLLGKHQRKELSVRVSRRYKQLSQNGRRVCHGLSGGQFGE